MSTPAQPAHIVGVIGAGTMGAGIAQLAARSGARTILHDPLPEALKRGAQYARVGLGKEAAKGRLSAAEADAAAARIEPVDDLAAFAPCELVIEAAPERLELKYELYARLSREIVGTECVLASNTSSLLVTAIAAAATNPERVVGMHFFNPAPIMRLLEVVAGEQSSERALALAHETGEAMSKTVIRAADGPGFLVNRCNRPFGLEALRLLQERIADIETIDRTMRVEGGFRMGPFELMDLVGVDTGLEISKSFYEQSFGEPRWRPSPIAARYVAAGRHGRKSGRGYYDYSRDPYRPPDPDPDPDPPARADANPRPAIGGVLERILCQVINECAFALGEGVGGARDIDTGMVLGLNYPRGPLAWADEIGLDHVLAVLDRLWEEYREERYRPAPALRSLVRTGRLGRASGAGFFAYDAAP
jgi:3-hydroxybutyryl-CoA dehydrogenase